MVALTRLQDVSNAGAQVAYGGRPCAEALPCVKSDLTGSSIRNLEVLCQSRGVSMTSKMWIRIYGGGKGFTCHSISFSNSMCASMCFVGKFGMFNQLFFADRKKLGGRTSFHLFVLWICPQFTSLHWICLQFPKSRHFDPPRCPQVTRRVTSRHIAWTVGPSQFGFGRPSDTSTKRPP